MLSDLSERAIARSDVPLDDFLQVLVGLVADLQLGTDVGTDSFVVLCDVDVHNVALMELPGESDVIISPRRRSEVELTSILFAQVLHGSF